MPSTPAIFDRKLLRAWQNRARALGPATFLIDRVAIELGERLSAVLRQFDRAVDVGTPTDAVRRVLAASEKVTTVVDGVAIDEEVLPFAAGSLDLVVSARYDSTKVEKLYKDVQTYVGWTPSDLRFAVRAMAEAGMAPDTFGKILVMAHEAAQFRSLKDKAPTALKKVANAPKIIRPSAPQPKPTVNQAALERLKKFGRGEDFMKLL